MKTSEELQKYILQKYPRLVIEPKADDFTVFVTPEEMFLFLTYLKEDEKLRFDNLMCISGVDEISHLDLVYHLSSYAYRHRLGIKVSLPRENPKIPSVTPLWPGADWHEREAYDLYGVIFENHPDLRRILLPEDWEGFPMRKDYRHWNLTPLPENHEEVTKDYPVTPAPFTQKIS